jgi:endonuclease/exonuclease/phosphatase family metal-dependent hydrolase
LRIKVLTFNIRYGIGKDGDNAWRFRVHHVADAILKHDPDIIGIQEAFKFQLDDLLPLLPQYGSAGVGREDGIDQGEHAKVLFRSERFKFLHEHTYWFSDTPDVPNSVTWGHHNTRICTQVRLRERQSEAEFEIHNLHIDHESAYARERSTKMLVERFPVGLPVIVTGDFNAGPETPEIRYLRDGGVVFDATPLLDNQGTYHGFTGIPELPRIDYIWGTRQFRMQTFGLDTGMVDGRYPSDHFPLWSILEL